MPAVARYGDICGSIIFAGASTVLTNGRPTAQIFNAVAGHGICPHARRLQVVPLQQFCGGYTSS